MTITRAVIKPGTVALQEGVQGQRTRTVTYVCVSSDGTDGTDDVLAAVDIEIGDSWNLDGVSDYTVCTKRNPKRLANSRTVWEVDYTFETQPGSPLPPPKPLTPEDLNKAPTVRPPELSIRRETRQEAIDRAYLVAGDPPTPAATATMMCNSAGERFAKPVMDTVSRMVMAYTRNELAYPFALAKVYDDVVNSDTFCGLAAGTWKCKPITGEWQFERTDVAVYGYWRVHYEFHYDAAGWDYYRLDEGTNYIENIGGTYKAVKAVDNNGIPLGLVPLDGNGGKLSEADRLSGDLIYRRYRRKLWLPFSSLGLTELPSFS